QTAPHLPFGPSAVVPDAAVELGDAFQRRERQGQGMLGHGLVAPDRTDRKRDAPGPEGVEIHVVVAHADLVDEAKQRRTRDVRGRELRTGHEQIADAGVILDRIARAKQLKPPALRQPPADDRPDLRGIEGEIADRDGVLAVRGGHHGPTPASCAWTGAASGAGTSTPYFSQAP